jgi:outer membrane protein assembly factor BamB
LGDVYMQKLHALAITTGAEKFGGPVLIRGFVRGRGVGNAHGTILFDPRRENPRAALLLSHGRVFLSWASSCDAGPYHGWVMAYDAHTLKQVAVFNTSPDANDAGIWMSDTGPAADDDGNLYVVTGNGRFDAPSGGRDYGDSLLKLRLDANGLTVADSFTPFNQKQLDANDEDLGSGGPVLLPDHLMLAGGKGAALYLIHRDHMGGYHEGSDAAAAQTISFGKDALFGAPAYWNGRVYVIAGGDVLRQFALRSGRLVRSYAAAGPKYPDAGATPAISAHNSQDGIVWAIASYDWQRSGPPAVLHAYDAADVRTELYNTEQNSARDRAGEALRFTTPLIANGRVYVGTRRELDVYSLLP